MPWPHGQKQNEAARRPRRLAEKAWKTAQGPESRRRPGGARSPKGRCTKSSGSICIPSWQALGRGCRARTRVTSRLKVWDCRWLENWRPICIVVALCKCYDKYHWQSLRMRLLPLPVWVVGFHAHTQRLDMVGLLQCSLCRVAPVDVAAGRPFSGCGGGLRQPPGSP